jgi:hypothetical protein
LDWYIRKFRVDRGFYVGGTYPSNTIVTDPPHFGVASEESLQGYHMQQQQGQHDYTCLPYTQQWPVACPAQPSDAFWLAFTAQNGDGGSEVACLLVVACLVKTDQNASTLMAFMVEPQPTES